MEDVEGSSPSALTKYHIVPKGAGRVLGRKEAKRVLNMDDFEKSMGGVKAKIDESTIDESPFAYKDIFMVMDMQSDLVDVIHHVVPTLNIKA